MKQRADKKLIQRRCHHYVWGAFSESFEWYYFDYFLTAKEAETAFETQQERGLWKCLVLGEIGEFLNKNGTTEQDYVHYRWVGYSNAAAACPFPERGYGLADSTNEAVRYAQLPVDI